MPSSRMRPSVLALASAAALLASCSDPAELPVPPAPYAPPPSSAVVEEGPVRIRRDVFLVPGVTPPPNPLTGGATPAEYNAVRVVRYRVDVDPPAPARAVAVLMPGFLGGASSYDPMARAIVRRSKEGEAFEAWAIDRRSNLLEDHHGLDVAEFRKDPEIAKRYYFEDEPAEGKTFAGFLDQASVDYASEWGLDTTIGDLRRVVELVATEERKARVFLVGHSLGATIVEEYAAWDFDGKPGYGELAGLVLVDGVARQEGAEAPTITEEDYLKGSSQGPNNYLTPGLETIRKTTRYIALPLLGLNVYPVAAIAGMRALWSPTAITEDSYRDNAFRTLLSITDIPRMTNRAAMGFAMDDASNGVSFAAVSCGESKGGALAEYDSLFGTKLLHPSDPTATYDWVEYDATNPREHTSLDDISRTWFEGPSLDFAEWYFPARLSLDAQAAATLVLKETDWPRANHGMRAIHGGSMDLPIFAAVAGLVGDTAALDPLRALVQNVPIGPGRPLAGKSRTEPDTFVVLDIVDLTHIDPLAGTDDGQGDVTKWYDSLTTWMTTNSPAGGVVLAPSAP
ncbi:alpha/beta fold hydrolase [Polyangium sp. 15x6]|uniref:alpha/beta fold hydrolase n=1 Tax=Polyangium sp. 15x6 TaxID=3042687 RepID=UPI00249B88CA|nr:alpha/beta fold hydrolase [Polyangium sp. 15x6]MDI3288954.1 alpha/beta fold hydrolase [Polyangium sp. 15x6]